MLRFRLTPIHPYTLQFVSISYTNFQIFFVLLDVSVYSGGAGTPPLPHQLMNRGTPPTPGKSQDRRGSQSKHTPPSTSKAGNMVSYEDIIRDSPRNTPKLPRNKPPTPPPLRKAQSLHTTESFKPHPPIISPKKSPTGEESSKVTEDVKLRQSE